MDEQLSRLMEESIQLELNISELYKLFHDLFDEDSDFWWRMLLEEKNHAALIRSIQELFVPKFTFPSELFTAPLKNIRQGNAEIRKLIKRYEENAPCREEAFNTALHLELAAGEAHFQLFMEKEPTSKIERIFQQLNSADRDHARRLRARMKALQIDETLPSGQTVLTSGP